MVAPERDLRARREARGRRLRARPPLARPVHARGPARGLGAALRRIGLIRGLAPRTAAFRASPALLDCDVSCLSLLPPTSPSFVPRIPLS